MLKRKESHMKSIQTVWVEDGCICCQACVNVLPEVFCFPDDRAEIVGAVRQDGITSGNEVERSALVIRDQDEAIREAADSCPISIIFFSEAA
jgi:ferredoxin